MPWPNPDPRELRVHLAGPADLLRVRLYSRAFVLLGERDTAGPHAAGWARALLPSVEAKGACYYQVQSFRGGRVGIGHGTGTLVRLR